MADARAAACLAVLTDAADQISETNHRVGQWSVEEHRLYVSGVGRYGKRWSVIASHVGTRTGTQVRSHAVRTQWLAVRGHVHVPTLHPLGLGVLVGRPHLRGSPIPPRLSLELRLPLSLLSPSFPRSFSLTHSRRLSTHSRRHSLSKRSTKRWPSKRTRRRHQRRHMGPDGSLDAVDGAVSTEWMSVPRATRACARTSNAGASRA